MIGALHGVSGCCQCCPLRRRLFCGGCSWVETSTNQDFFWHGLTGCVLVLVRQCRVPLGVWWCQERAGAWFVWVVFGALLGPEATGPFCSNAWGHLLVFLLFLLPVSPVTV